MFSLTPPFPWEKESRKQSQVVNCDDHLMTSARETNIGEINDLVEPFVGKYEFKGGFLGEEWSYWEKWIAWYAIGGVLNFENNIWRVGQMMLFVRMKRSGWKRVVEIFLFGVFKVIVFLGSKNSRFFKFKWMYNEFLFTKIRYITITKIHYNHYNNKIKLIKNSKKNIYSYFLVDIFVWIAFSGDVQLFLIKCVNNLYFT